MQRFKYYRRAVNKTQNKKLLLSFTGNARRRRQKVTSCVGKVFLRIKYQSKITLLQWFRTPSIERISLFVSLNMGLCKPAPHVRNLTSRSEERRVGNECEYRDA